MNNQSTKDKDARSSNAMAATSHPLATEEALKILKIGGNAVDASIAASIVLSVVEPNATSIGGDCFAIVKMDNKDAVSFNGSGLAPEKLNYNFFNDSSVAKGCEVAAIAFEERASLSFVDWLFIVQINSQNL